MEQIKMVSLVLILITKPETWPCLFLKRLGKFYYKFHVDTQKYIEVERKRHVAKRRAENLFPHFQAQSALYHFPKTTSVCKSKLPCCLIINTFSDCVPIVMVSELNKIFYVYNKYKVTPCVFKTQKRKY